MSRAVPRHSDIRCRLSAYGSAIRSFCVPQDGRYRLRRTRRDASRICAYRHNSHAQELPRTFDHGMPHRTAHTG